MLRSIGRRSEDESLLSLLGGCHERIRRFTAMAVALAGAPAAPDAGETARAIRRYFAEALPLHEADEEESLAPRLRGRTPAIDAALRAMTAQHAAQHALVAALVAACDRIAAGDALADTSAAARAALADGARALSAAFDAHLAAEEAIIFPAVAALPAATQAEIVAELRARRT